MQKQLRKHPKKYENKITYHPSTQNFSISLMTFSVHLHKYRLLYDHFCILLDKDVQRDLMREKGLIQHHRLWRWRGPHGRGRIVVTSCWETTLGLQQQENRTPIPQPQRTGFFQQPGWARKQILPRVCTWEPRQADTIRMRDWAGNTAKPAQTSDLQSCEIMNGCWPMLLSLWLISHTATED